MSIEKKKQFLINVVYWLVIGIAAYLAFAYLVPVSMPFLLGVLVAWMVVKLCRRLGCNHRFFRLGISILVYVVIGTAVGFGTAELASLLSGLVRWLPEVYEARLLPFGLLCREWVTRAVLHLDPTLVSALEVVLESLVSALQNLFTYLSGFAVDLVSGLATGVPNLVLSVLTMLFSTFFLVSDYDRIAAFAEEYTPRKAKVIAGTLWSYLRNTLFVVIRSYILIMVITFTELSILFRIFGIENAMLKAAAIAVFDLLPILGTGGIMIPWVVISLVLGHTAHGIKLAVIYAIVTVVRNYVEPKIVGAQLGLHPIISLVSMFVGLQLFGIWGLFGFPVGISYLWKQRMEKQAKKEV